MLPGMDGAKVTVRTIRARKGKEPLVALTAYDALLARALDEAGVDLLLVGDSVGNTVLGFETTIPVTLDMMVHHTAAVARAKPRALVAADLPFGIAQGEFTEVLSACRRLVQEGGAEAVKIEGNHAMAENFARLVDAGIPVWGHLGLRPQQVHETGYRRFGRTEAGRERLLRDAEAFQRAGCFALLGEMIEPTAATMLREAVDIPLIGIGCGPDCDGQILVTTDMLDMGSGDYPSFVGKFGKVGAAIREGVEAYAQAVRERKFPQ